MFSDSPGAAGILALSALLFLVLVRRGFRGVAVSF